MKKRSRRKASKPPQGRPSTSRRKASARASEPKALLYKVVELSNVDERSLEQTINQWVGKGWALDGVQFAMRESSKRPSMAFLLFTRSVEAVEAHEGLLETEPADVGPSGGAERSDGELAALAQASAQRAHARLVALASDDDERRR